MNFGEALLKLKNGQKIAREGWNGKGMSVIFVPEIEENGIRYNPFFQIKNVNGSVSTWVPSINDCLAADWYEIIEDENKKIPDHIMRMIAEFKELESKLYKAEQFLNSEKSHFLDKEQRTKLVIQIEYMERYAEVLQERIKYDSKKISKI